MYEVIYKCRCMATERTLNVRNREPDEDITDYMEDVVRREITDDHRMQSPICMAPALEYAKLPMPENAPGVGMKPKLNA